MTFPGINEHVSENENVFLHTHGLVRLHPEMLFLHCLATGEYLLTEASMARILQCPVCKRRIRARIFIDVSLDAIRTAAGIRK